MSRCTTRLSFPVIFLLWSCSLSVTALGASGGGGLSPEEEHRLVMKADASVIDEKLKEMPYGVLMAPAPLEEHDLPIPTMDPPLPENPKGSSSVKITTAAGLGPLNNNKAALSERIRNAMKTMKERMRTLQSSRPRLPKKPLETPKAPKFPRPSSLVTSNPSDLEVAMKRIEIMASRAGFNMSSIPRRSQLQIVSRLAPKLPVKMSHAVKEELESMSGKLYHYLPEPARDPLIEDDQAFLQHFMDQFDHPHVETDEFYKEVNSHGQQQQHHHSPQKLNSFDVSQVSLTDDPAHEPISISESMTSSISSAAGAAASPGYLESAAPDIHLMPPKFDAGEGEHSAVHTYSVSSDDEGVPKPSALVSQYPTHHVEESDPLVTLSSEISNAKSFSAYNATITNRDRLQKSFKVGSVKTYGGGTTSTSAPTDASPFNFDDLLGPTVSVPPKPIRVSVISKDSILVNDSSKEVPGSGGVRTIKYVHVEPLKGHEAVELLTGFDKYLPAESVSKEVRINPKEISVHIDKSAYVPKSQSHLSLDTYEIPEVTAPPTTTTTTEAPTTTTEDPYPLTDEEIAATVAELKKYEAEMAGLRQSENSLEVEYPYRLLTPHPLEYPDHPDHPQPSSLEEDSDLVTHLDELLAEIQGGSGKTQESLKSQSQQQQLHQSSAQLQGTVVPSPASSPPLMMGPGHRRPHPMLKHRPPLGRPGLGRPLMMGSRLRPLIRHPPAGFPRPSPGGGSPPRINEVTVSQLPHKFNKECDYFSDELCLLVQDYPIEAITEAMEQNPQVSNALLSKEALHNQKSTSYIDGVHDLGSLENEAAELGSKHPDFAGEGGFLCPSKVAYGRIKKAKSSTSGDWKFIVNYGDKTQTLRLEKCLQPGDACSYIMPHFRTACTQVHNYHRLLAWDPEKGLHTDVFKVPTCCTCHVLGYYVPGTKKSLPQTPAMPPMRRRDHLGLGPARFMGPPRGLRRMIPHLGLHGRKHGLHPMMQLLQNPQSSPVVSPLNVQPPTQVASNNPQSSANSTSSSQNSEDEVLRSLLLQYATLREKITKLKDSKSTSTSTTSTSSAAGAVKRSSKLYSHWPKDIIKALRKRKRQSTISSKNNKMKKPSPEMLKKLKNLLTNSTKLENNPKLKQKIHSYLLKLKKSSSSSKSGKSFSGKGHGRRGGRNMKMKLSVEKKSSSKQNKTKPGLSKADAKKRLLFLLSAAKKKLQEEKKVKAQRSMSMSTSFHAPTSTSQNRLRSSSSRNNRMLSIPPPLPPARSKVNFESHPIWNYFHKLQNAVAASTSHAHPPLSGARRLRRLF